jgi:hypothetical protein
MQNIGAPDEVFKGLQCTKLFPASDEVLSPFDTCDTSGTPLGSLQLADFR